MTKQRILAIFIIFGLLVLGLGVWYFQRNIFTKGALKLEILAPDEVELGEEFEYSVKYKNNGNFTIEEPRLIFEYPEESIVEEGKSLRQEMDLEDIYPGEEKSVPFKAILLGKKDETRKAQATLTYRVKNIKARFESNTSRTTLIKFVPLTFGFDFPSKIEAGRNIKIMLNYQSNVAFPVSNVRIEIDYPQGFEFLKGKPKGLAENEWEIGILNKGDSGRIEIEGKLSGDFFSQKVFRARLVSWQEDKKIALEEIAKGVELVQPSIYISWQVNGSPQYTANLGDYLHYEITFKNIGDVGFENLFLTAKLEGGMINSDTIQPGSGKFQKEIDSLIWDQAMVPQLRLLPPLEEGKVEFWVKVKNEIPSFSRNPLIRARIDLNQIKEEITTKINSRLVILQQGFFSQGPFKNIGPIPPQVGNSTSYTISWQAKSLYNDAKNVKVKAILPSNVRLTGEIDPKDTKLSFDPISRELVWDIGELFAGEEGRKINFQIALTPDLSQREKAAELITQVKIIAEDAWTEATIEKEDSIVDTTLPYDPTVIGQGIVQ